MTDSTQGVSEARKREKLEALRDKQSKDYLEVSELPTWSKFALIECEVLGRPRNEVAKKYKRKGGAISKYARSPAGKKLIAELKERADPEQIAQWLVQSEQAAQAIKYIVLADTAEETGDLALAERIRRTILQSGGGLAPPKKDQDTRPVFVLNLPGWTGKEPPVLEAKEVSTSHRLLEDGE